MTKQEIRQRVLHNGKPISMDDFMWDEKTNTFSSNLNGLVLDFKGVNNCTFTTGYNCTFNTGSSCTFTTGYNCTFKTGSYCTFTTYDNCTFTTGYNCTFKTGSSCTFTTGYNCTFKTGSSCTFNTGSDCNYTTGSYCVVVRRDIYEVIELVSQAITRLIPYSKKGYIVKLEGEEFFHYPNQTDRIEIIDGVVSKVIQSKGNVLKVINEEETEPSYIVTDGINYAHGKTIKEAKASLIYKISDRNTDEYNGLTLESKLTFEECVQMYRKITGSCESQTKLFAEQHRFKGKKTIAEIVEITKGQYNNKVLREFFTK